MGDTLGFVSLYSHAWEWTFSTNGLMTVRASSAHGTGKKKKIALLGKIRGRFCFPAVPAARLKVSACNGNLLGPAPATTLQSLHSNTE